MKVLCKLLNFIQNQGIIHLMLNIVFYLLTYVKIT